MSGRAVGQNRQLARRRSWAKTPTIRSVESPPFHRCARAEICRARRVAAVMLLSNVDWRALRGSSRQQAHAIAELRFVLSCAGADRPYEWVADVFACRS